MMSLSKNHKNNGNYGKRLRSIVSRIRVVVVSSFVCVISILPTDQLHAARIEVQAHPEWVLLGGDGSRFSSFGELTGYWNALQEAAFEACKSTPQYSCTKVIFSGKYPSPPTADQFVNGDNWWFTLLATATTETRDLYGNVTTSVQERNNHYGVNVYYMCSLRGWLFGQEWIGGDSNNVRRFCFIDLPDPPMCPKVKNPIDPGTGDKYEQETDYSTADGLLRVERVYVNQRQGWRFDREPQLVDMTGRHPTNACMPSVVSYLQGSVDVPTSYCYEYTSPSGNNTEVDVVFPSGNRIRFYENTPSVFTVETGGVGELVLVDPLTNNNALWRLKAADDKLTFFDEEGHVTHIVNRSGRTLTYTYTDGHLTSKSDDLGRTLQYGYDTEGRLTTVTLPDSGQIQYAYDGPFLSQVTPADGTTRQYLYNEANLVASTTAAPYALTGIIDENGERYATWSYDSQGRAVSSEHANGADSGTITYNSDGTATLTDTLGKQTTFHYTTVVDQKKISQVEGHPSANCAGANQAYTYDANGFVSSKTDWNGNVTTYVHDTRGLEISRTEASGTPEAKTITTEWHSNFRVPVRITETEKVTEFTYDTNGRLINRRETISQ